MSESRRGPQYAPSSSMHTGGETASSTPATSASVELRTSATDSVTPLVHTLSSGAVVAEPSLDGMAPSATGQTAELYRAMKAVQISERAPPEHASAAMSGIASLPSPPLPTTPPPSQGSTIHTLTQPPLPAMPPQAQSAAFMQARTGAAGEDAAPPSLPPTHDSAAPRSRASAQTPGLGCNLIINYLPSSLTEAELRVRLRCLLGWLE